MKYLNKSFAVPYIGKAYSEGWERMFGKKEPPVREWNGAKLGIERIYHGYSECRYIVKLVSGNWPSDSDLITLCDGDTPPDSHHFGGWVRRSEDEESAEVAVYVPVFRNAAR